MSYRVPSAEVLAVAIADVLREHESVGSQALFTALVREKLRDLDPEYAVAEERVRRTAVQLDMVRMEVQSRDSGKRARMKVCPVCGGRMLKKRNRTLSGGTTTLGYRCEKCPYSTGSTRRIPTRYVFHSALPRARKYKRDEGQSTL